MAKKKLFFMLLIIMFSLLPGCSSAPSVNSSTPIESSSKSVPDIIPSPVPGKGSVVGQLEVANPKRLVGLIVYLGRVVVVDNKYGGFLDTNTAPVAFVESGTGKFYFPDVEPGEYSLIIYEVEVGGKAYLDSDGSAVLIKVESGKVLDLGKIQFME